MCLHLPLPAAVGPWAPTAQGPSARVSVLYPAFGLTYSHPANPAAAPPGRRALNAVGRSHETGSGMPRLEGAGRVPGARRPRPSGAVSRLILPRLSRYRYVRFLGRDTGKGPKVTPLCAQGTETVVFTVSSSTVGNCGLPGVPFSDLAWPPPRCKLTRQCWSMDGFSATRQDAGKARPCPQYNSLEAKSSFDRFLKRRRHSRNNGGGRSKTRSQGRILK